MTILALDEGTTGVTASLVDAQLALIATASEDFPQYFPTPGQVEHDLNEIWSTTLKVIKQVLEKAEASRLGSTKKISAIGITNQRETICFWDRKTGEPLSRAIVWQDRRTAELCQKLKAQGLEPEFQKRTGLLLDPYFSGTKVTWAFENWPAIKTAHTQGRLAIGTIDSYIVYRLSGQHRAHVTDPSNASRTLCYGLQTENWDSELCEKLKISKEIWPEIKPSAGIFSKTEGVPGLIDGIPITGILGDQQSALMGQACLKPGMAKCTYGTGAFVLLNTGQKPVPSQHRLITTVAWKIGNQPTEYALEGSAFIAGAAVQWLRDGLGFIQDSSEVEALATSVPSTDGVYFVPALTGLGAPHWDPNARGLFCGLTRGSTKAHLARAVLEGIALQIAEILDCMNRDAPTTKLLRLNVDGGASANTFLMQFQSDVLGVELYRPKNLETTSLGAVFAAGLGAGIWKSIQEIEKVWKQDAVFKPKLSEDKRREILRSWNTAVARTVLKES